MSRYSRGAPNDPLINNNFQNNNFMNNSNALQSIWIFDCLWLTFLIFHLNWSKIDKYTTKEWLKQPNKGFLSLVQMSLIEVIIAVIDAGHILSSSKLRSRVQNSKLITHSALHAGVVYPYGVTGSRATNYCIRTLPRGGMFWKIHSPRPKRFPKGGESRGPRGAKSPPEGNLEGRGGCIFQCIPTRGSVRTFFQN